MRIAADGTWFHEGRPIRRIALVKLFSTVLKRDEAGLYWLETPVERGRIEVEDAPFVMQECRIGGAGRDQQVELRSNIDLWVPLDSAHPLRVEENPKSGEPRPYIRLDGGLEGRLGRNVYYELAERVVADPAHPGRLGLWSFGQFFDLGPAA